MNYNFKKETETAILPTRHTPVSAGVDFYADELVIIPAGEQRRVSTGISWKPGLNTLECFNFPFTAFLALIIQSRSGLVFKYGIESSNAGVIDQDYVSNNERKAVINVMLYNHSDMVFIVNPGDKICQGVPQLIPCFDDVESLDDDRQGKGFGSSDEKENKCIEED